MYKGNGSTALMRSTNTRAFSNNWAIAFFYENDSAPTSGFERPFHWDATDTDSGVAFLWSHNNASFRRVWQVYDGSFHAVQYTTSLLANTRYHLCCTYDGTTLRIYLDGVEEATSTAPGTISGGASPIMHLFASSFNNSNTDGEMGEFGFWKFTSGTLTADEVAALADGYAPDHVRPESLEIYYPMFGDLDPEKNMADGGDDNGGSIAGLSKVDHPPMIYRANHIAHAIPAGAAQTITAPVIRVNLSLPSSTVVGSGTAAITPVAVRVNLNLPAGTITGSGAAPITPTAIRANLNLPTATITGSGTAAITPNAVRLNLNLPTAALTAIGVIGAPVVRLNLTLPAGTITGSGTAPVTPGPVSINLNLPTSVLTGSGAAPVTGSVVRLNLTLPLAVVTGGVVTVHDVLTAAARDFTLNASERDFDLTASA